MKYIRVTKENIEKEHICCAISSNRDIQVISKKNWLTSVDDKRWVTFLCYWESRYKGA